MTIASQYFTVFQCLLAILAAIILGMSKAGFSSISILTVSILAYIFGMKSSTGILLPMLSCADILAVVYYHRHTQWKQLLSLLPWMFIGILLGTWFGKDISEVLFKQLMAVLIFLTVLSMIWSERRDEQKVPTHWAFSSIMGLLAGFTSMVGNLAGAFSNVYFLAMRLPKDQFIGTVAWLFLLVNAFKIPFHVFVWNTIRLDSLSINLALLPFMVLGFFLGIRIVRVINEDHYRKIIIGITAVVALFILISL